MIGKIGLADALAIEARKHRRRTRAIEAMIVMKHPKIQTKTLRPKNSIHPLKRALLNNLSRIDAKL
jgi:hypothetical protein